jgi:hypothetical protein
MKRNVLYRSEHGHRAIACEPAPRNSLLEQYFERLVLSIRVQ